jgi:type IV secretory pathway VirB10-like protein
VVKAIWLRASAIDPAKPQQAGQRITEKNLNIQPTITARPRWPLRVIVHKHLVLGPYRG